MASLRAELAVWVISDLRSHGHAAEKYVTRKTYHTARDLATRLATPRRRNDRCELHLLLAFDTILGFVCQGQRAASSPDRKQEMEMKLGMALITAIFCAAAPAWSQTQPGTPATTAPQHIPGQTAGAKAPEAAS